MQFSRQCGQRPHRFTAHSGVVNQSCEYGVYLMWNGMETHQAQLMRVLYDEHGRALWGYALRLTGDRAAAQDVVQESMLRVWRRPDVLDQSAGSARAWLFTVARRIVIDEWRTGRSRAEILVEEAPDEPSVDDIDAVLTSWQVTEALARLSPQHGMCCLSATTGAGRLLRRPRCSAYRPAP